MGQQLVIIGAGFAGMYAALASARLRDASGKAGKDLEIKLVAPQPTLVVRPRLYEPSPETLTAPLDAVLDAVGVEYVKGRVEDIDITKRAVEFDDDGRRGRLDYDRAVLAAGSRLFRPPVPGLDAFAFSVDQLDDAVALDKHLHGLAALPDTPARNTVVVAGGGFTGIEVATEMPARLRSILGLGADIRVVIVDRGAAVGSDMGPGPRPLIESALRTLSVEAVTGVGVTAITADGASLSNGERISAATVIWSAGMRANPLTALIPGERDDFGRLVVDGDLRVPGAPGLFAAGDVAKAATDELGNTSLMSCQHANRLGAAAGHNAAAELLGVPTEPYRQKNYVTCLDLGGAGALFTRGWDRIVEMTGEKAKATKVEINTKWIYPPAADRASAFAAADWARLVDY